MSIFRDFSLFGDSIREIVGDYEILAQYRQGSTRTGVFKLRARTGECFLKTFNRKERWGPAVFAYKNWVPLIQPYAPKLIGAFDAGDIQGILTSPLEGMPLREATIDERHLIEVYHMAGVLTRKLHDGAVGIWFGRPDEEGNPIEIYQSENPVSYIKTHILNFYEEGTEKGYLSSDEAHICKWALDHVEVFKSEKPLPVNWDSSPGNWLVNNNGDFVGMIDFEHMLWGVDVEEFPKMIFQTFPVYPQRREAFFNGYGTPVIDRKHLQLRIAYIKYGLASIVWGMDSGNDRFRDLGRDSLKRIMSDKWL